MNYKQPSPKVTEGQLRSEIKKEYTHVALDPHKGYHFHTGCDAADRIGYDESLYASLPKANIDSFAGTGNPFILGPINPGETVIDIGSGSGFDSMIASQLVGEGGKVFGIDMTDEMLKKAQSGVEEMGASNVESRKGLADKLPLPDDFADVVISNGVLNLTLDKITTLKEWARVLKPGGRLYIGDILVEKELSQAALDNIALWTG
jgi:SAM-dependent methyltransferase